MRCARSWFWRANADSSCVENAKKVHFLTSKNHRELHKVAATASAGCRGISVHLRLHNPTLNKWIGNFTDVRMGLSLLH